MKLGRKRRRRRDLPVLTELQAKQAVRPRLTMVGDVSTRKPPRSKNERGGK